MSLSFLPRNKISARDKVIAMLFALLVINSFVLYRLHGSIASIPDRVTVDIPSDTSISHQRKWGERDRDQVYGFARIVHELLNNWEETDEKVSVSANVTSRIDHLTPIQLVNDYRCTMTPEFYSELKQRMENFVRKGHYFGQSRYARIIPSKAFSDKNTYKLGNSWVVDLPIDHSEYWKGSPLHKTPISFKYRVIQGQSTNVGCPASTHNFLIAGYYAEPVQIVVE